MGGFTAGAHTGFLCSLLNCVNAVALFFCFWILTVLYFCFKMPMSVLPSWVFGRAHHY